MIPCAVTLLLACEACPPNVTVDPTEGPPPEPATCRLFETRPLANSLGSGPPVARMTPTGTALLLNTDRTGLSYWELDTDLRLVLSHEGFAPPDSGALAPLDMASTQQGPVLVTQSSGMRQVVVFRGNGDAPPERVDVALIAPLGQRITAQAVAPQVGAGLQWMTHTSGSQRVQVGRIAGELLVTRPVDTGVQLSAPVAAASTSGDLRIFSAERREDDTRAMVLRAIASDGQLLDETTVADLSDARRASQLRIASTTESTLVWWVERGQQGSGVGRAEIDTTTGSVTNLPPLVGQAGRDIQWAGALLEEERRIWLWTTTTSDGTTLWAQANDLAGQPLGPPDRLLQIDSADLRGFSAQPTGRAQARAFWRQVDRGAQAGPVVTTRIDCQ